MGARRRHARGELVGLLFDGNIHSISGSYWFDTRLNRAVAVHPFVVLVSVLFGSTLFGVLGALLAIPVAAAIQITIREVTTFRNTRAEDLPPPGVQPPETS